MSSTFAPSPAELALVNQIFTQFDTQKVGILTGDVAVKVFDGAKLPPTVLGEIWGIADDENNGFLTKKGVAVAARLIGWAQKGEKVSKALITKPGPLATIQGIQTSLAPQSTGMSSPKSPPPGLPILTPQDKAKFNRIFQSSGPVNGLLSGDKARDVFVKSNLHVDKLSQIWGLADTQDRGSLDVTDFTIAMYLIQASMSGQLSFVPSSLPPGLYEQAGGRASNGVASHATGGSGSFHSPVSSAFSHVSRHATGQIQPLQAQSTGQANLSGFAPTVPARRPVGHGPGPTIPAFPSVQTQSAVQWDVTPSEKASSDRFFDTLDTTKRGYIEGDVAVPFMLQSKLPEDILAQVWDLADINNDGRLTRDGFAVAMHLIQGKLAGKEVPNVLPPTLVPPSMRLNGTPFAAPPKPQEPLRDLLWDDSPPTSAVNTTSQNDLQSQLSGNHAPFNTMPTSPRHPQPTRSLDPFEVPVTNTSSLHKDLLGDDEDTSTTTQLHDKSAEIGNVQNQFSSTNRSLQTAKAERETLESTLANQAAQLSALQTQLASAKAAYDTETTLLGSLRERFNTQTADMQRVREELIRAESDLSAIREEKSEIEGSVLRDKEEVRDLNRSMIEAGTQIEGLKAEIEKAKKDAKQQKGLLAIAKKQLATKEAERLKVEKELQDARDDLTTTTKEREESEIGLQRMASIPSIVPERAKSPVDSLRFAAAQPLPVTPDVTGPMSPASGRSNNPFDRLAMSSGSSTPNPQAQSPFLPFTNSTMPTPPGLSAVPVSQPTQDDPFGFSEAFDTEDETERKSELDTVDFEAATPRPADSIPHGIYSDVVASPTSDSDFFTTPPTTADNHQPEGDISHISSIDSAAVHFPAIDEITSDVPGNVGEERQTGETDLGPSIQELDVDETDSDSDSDSDEDEDNRPLGVIKAEESQKASEAIVDSSLSSVPSGISFDDAFGDPSISAVPTSAPTADAVPPFHNGSSAPAAELDAFGAPVNKLPSPFEVPANGASISSDVPTSAPSDFTLASSTSGLNAFDEAMGKISSGDESGQDASNFPFTAQFEDNFDFASASATTSNFPPPPSATNGAPASFLKPIVPGKETSPSFAQPTSNAVSAAPPAQNSNLPAFDNAFSNGLWNSQSDVGGISFDEVFGGFDASQSLKLDNSFSSRSSNIFTSAPSHAPSEPVKPFPTVSPPTSPRGPTSPRVTSIRSSSPIPRSGSPPPRVSSPKQRPSTSSSNKEVVQEKPVPPPRHSKLSIRLPFGKKKKQDSVPAPVPAPPIPSAQRPMQHLALVEEPTGTVTPAVEDDVEPVKQLSAMGFSRNQTVAALEAHGYDVQRALNSLLGAP
ncbi:hypothetical protein SERLA73DRAFT_76138 [Serpula lacrymans var. lacrymans S7.3]|uniref:Uncharacterized protein n=1 Tax=Serpula lacrymans var. lacrymans (strain S7.3) TaxID=936435 RepID=F8Q6A8_SERL3|nr:hypothetical protein SERLA73DRAFT_76138 [Serpula lacrymans var. lacrymans S7.3]